MSTLVASEWSDAVEFTVRPLGEGYSEVAKLIPIEGQSDSKFGRGLAVDGEGEFMLAPLMHYNTPYVKAGRVDVYQRLNNVWKRVTTIQSPTPALNEGFGVHAALSRDGLTAYIGAEGNAVKGSNTGCLYIFTRPTKTSNNWVYQTVLYPDDPQINGYFGTSVAVSSDQKTLAVGKVEDPRYINAGITSGAIYIFKKGTDGLWYQNQKLVSSDLGGTARLGRAIALSGNGKELVSVAPRVYTEINNPYNNTIYHFSLVGPVYIQTAVTHFPDSKDGVVNGGGVCLNEDGTIMAASNNYDAARGVAYTGDVYIFEKTAFSVWTPKQKIIPRTDAALFGTDVALTSDGSILMVGARLDDTASTDSGAIYFYDRINDGFQYQQSLLPKTPTAEDRFGRAIALNSTGDMMIVGAFCDDDDTDPTTYPGLGSAYVFIRNGSTWTQVQKIIPSAKTAWAWFGIDVAVSQDGAIAVIGCPGELSGGVSKGGFYYYKNVNGSWVETAKVFSPDGVSGDQFATSVTLDASGSYLIVGCAKDDTAALNGGSIYIYTRSGDTWTFQQKITSPESEAEGYFGYRTAVNGDATAMAVGCYSKDVSGLTDSGAVYYYTRSGSAWTYRTRITSPRSAAGAGFGLGLAMTQDGNTLYVGAFNDLNKGAVFIFNRNGYVWNYDRELTDPLPMSLARFGIGLALSGDGSILAVGADNASETLLRAGRVNVYIKPSTFEQKLLTEPFIERSKFYADDTSAGDYFGVSCTLNAEGDYAIVGACYDADKGTNAGACYAFKRVGHNWVQKAKFYGLNTKEGDLFGVAVSMNSDANFLVVGAPVGSTEGRVNSGAIYLFDREGETWRQRGLPWAHSEAIANNGRIFARSVAVSDDGVHLLIAASAADQAPGGPASGLVYYVTYDGSDFTERQKFWSSTATQSDYFGHGLSMSKDGLIAIVGAPYDDNGVLTDDGSAFVFTRSGYTWTQEQKLIAPEAASGMTSLWTSAISGDGSIILLSSNNSAGMGAFYLYKRVLSTYTLVKKLYSKDGQAGDALSFSLALNYDGAVALSGAVGDDDRGSSAGAVYTFGTGDIVGEGYRLCNTIYCPEDQRSVGDNFAAGVALSGDGNYALIGRTFGNAKNGDFFAFERSGVDWISKGSFTANDLSNTDLFGLQISMSLDAQHAVISAQMQSASSQPEVGSIYYFTRSGDTWIQQQKIVCPDVEAYANFGAGLAISGDSLHLLVGAENKDVGGNTVAGKVYYFTRSGNTWTLASSFTQPTGPVEPWRFGGGIALNYTGDYAMVGGVFTSLTGYASGAVNVLNRSGNTWTGTGLIESPEKNSESTAFGIGIAISRDLKIALIGASIADGLYRDEGAVYLYERNAITYKWDFVRKIARPFRNFISFGRAVAMSENVNHVLVSEPRSGYAGSETGAFHYFSMGRESDIVPVDDNQHRFRSAVVPIDAGPLDQFGYKTAIHPSGNWMIVGARNKDLGGIEAVGKYYSYRRIGNKWVYHRSHNGNYDPGMGINPAFGASLAWAQKTGGYYAIGAPNDATYGASLGAVYLYTVSNLSPTTFDLPSFVRIASNAPQSGENFGEGVALSGDAEYIAVGAPFYSGTVTNQGRVQIFTRVGSVVTHQATIVAPTPQSNHRFGNPVAINGAGDVLAVSAYHDSNAMNDGASLAGAVFIYKRVGSVWSFAEKILPPEVTTGFGIGLAYAENRKLLLVSAFKPGQVDASVYQYDLSGSNAVYQRKALTVKAGISDVDGQYPPSLSTDAWGRWIAAGCFYKDLSGVDSGEVRMFSTMDFNFQTEPYLLMGNEKKALQLKKILPPVLNASFNFGDPVKISGDDNYLAVSEHYAAVAGVTNAGRVRIFTKNTEGNWVLQTTLENPLPVANDYFGTGLSFNEDATYLIVGAYRADTTAADAGILYTYTRSGTVWTRGASINIPEAVSGNEFGISTALSTNQLYLAVGAQVAGGIVAGSGAVYLFSRSNTASAWTYLYKLWPSDGALNDGFGRSVSFSEDGSRMVVTAYVDSGAVNYVGSVYIYKRPDLSLDNWILQAKIYAPEGITDDRFGISASISADGAILAVGASARDDRGMNSGCVYIYTCRGNDWKYRFKIYPDDPIAGQSFGISVCFSKYANHLYVGAQSDPQAGANGGAVYDFLINTSAQEVKYGSRLVPAYRFSDPVLASGDEFCGGSAISEDGTMMLVGYRKDVSTGNKGYVWFYKRDQGKNNFPTAPTAIFGAPDGAASDGFGEHIATDSTLTHILVCATGAPLGGVERGKVYYFTRSGDTFTFVQSITSPVPTDSERFAAIVAMNDAGDIALIGNYNSTPAITGGTARGSVHVMTRSGSTWTQQQVILAPDKADGDNFGTHIAVNSDATQILITARFDDDSGADTGSVYYYTRSGSVYTFVNKVYDPIPQTDTRWGGALSLNSDGTIATIGNSKRVINGSVSGVINRYKRTGSVWKRYEEVEGVIPTNVWAIFDLNVYVSRNQNFMIVPDNAGVSGRNGGHTLYANPTVNPEFFYK